MNREEFQQARVDMTKGEVQCPWLYPNSFSPGGSNCALKEGHDGPHRYHTGDTGDVDRWIPGEEIDNPNEVPKLPKPKPLKSLHLYGDGEIMVTAEDGPKWKFFKPI